MILTQYEPIRENAPLKKELRTVYYPARKKVTPVRAPEKTRLRQYDTNKETRLDVYA